MKINANCANGVYSSKLSFTRNNVTKSSQPAQKSDNKMKTALLVASLAGLGVAAGAMIYKSKKPKNIQFKELKETYQKIISDFPEDKTYYETLARGINMPAGEEYKLASITGPAQLQSILKNASPQDFYLGKNLEGVKNRTLRINLHNHTTASDGRLTPKEMIEQGARWADEVVKTKGKDDKPAFVLGITDHDTLDGAREAVSIIAQNPEKYKNLKLVLGSEVSVAHTNPKDVRSPMNFELLGYGLNPFNEKMNGFLENLKKNRSQVVSRFTDSVKEKYPQYDLNAEDTKSFHSNLRNMRTNGVLYLQEEYINHKMMFTDFVNAVNEKIIPQGQEKLDATSLFRGAKDNYYYLKDTSPKKFSIPEYYRDSVLSPVLQERGLLTEQNKSVYEDIFKADFSARESDIKKMKDGFLPTLSETNGYIIRPDELFATARESGEQGFFGVAHPGLINAGMFSDDVIRTCDASGFDKGEHLAWRLYSHLKTVGGDYFKATEANYQSYPHNDAGAMHWRKYMGEDKANEFGLLKAGGIDCHKTSLFKKHTLLSEKEVVDNNLEGIV